MASSSSSVSSSSVAPSVNVHRCATGVMYSLIKNDPTETVKAVWQNQGLLFSFQDAFYVVPVGDHRFVFESGKDPIVTPVGPSEPFSPRKMHACGGDEV